MTQVVPTDTPREHQVREVAHDFNNLLTAIIGAADAIMERSAVDPETHADMANIREGARRGAALVRRLQSGARAPRTLSGIISVNDTIRATSRLLAHRLGPNISLVLDLEEPDSRARAEPSQLDRTLLNLIANARHATGKGGVVTLRTARRQLAAADPRMPDTIPIGDYVVIAIEDTGSGIPGDQVKQIFDAGFTSRRHAGGFGLGLASVRDMVRGSDGFLSVESVEGHGTCFEIYLPRLIDVVRPPPAEEPRSAARTVLLVEDDLLVRQVAERILRGAGWTVTCVETAEAALEALTASPCALMISDVVLPGMDGLDLARLVMARWADLPIILASGYERSPEDPGFGTANVTFLTKPYGQADLLDAVARMVGRQEASPAS